MKEGLWNIVDDTEVAPDLENDRYTKFLTRRKKKSSAGDNRAVR